MKSPVTADLAAKVAISQEIIREAYARYPLEKLAVAWTGGKDSTVVLWLIREVCRADGLCCPTCFCIDEGDMFDEVRAFLARYAADWGLALEMVHNEDVSRAAGGVLGARVAVSALNARNRAEVARLGYTEETFPYEPESYVGNHLMKTAALNQFLEERGIAAFFEGIRWDEQEARSKETYFSPREGTSTSPAHDRVSPILHFTERDVWAAIHTFDIPYCALYEQGYRSLGARVTTAPADTVPAWEQDLEHTPERGGRRQDKEGLMKRLRELGYM